MSSQPTLIEDRRQAWRMVGAMGMLVAIGIFGLLAGYGFSDHANDEQSKSLHDKLDRQAGEILANRARINQLEGDYARRGIPIPAPPVTTTTTTQPPRRTPSSTSTTSTTRPPSTSTTSTTTTTVPPKPCTVNVAGVCIR